MACVPSPVLPQVGVERKRGEEGRLKRSFTGSRVEARQFGYPKTPAIGHHPPLNIGAGERERLMGLVLAAVGLGTDIASASSGEWEFVNVPPAPARYWVTHFNRENCTEWIES